jgi:hypothetical protein
VNKRLQRLWWRLTDTENPVGFTRDPAVTDWPIAWVRIRRSCLVISFHLTREGK